MALSYVGDSNPVFSVTTTTPSQTLNAGAAGVGDHAVICVVNKRATFTPATPAGWTLIGTAQVGSGTPGANSGPLRISLYYQQVPSETWTLPAFAVSGTGAIISAGLMVWRAPPAAAVTFNVTTGSDTAANTTWSVTGGAVLPLVVGDVLLVVDAVTSNDPVFSSPTASAPGVTLGALANPWFNSSGASDTLRQIVYKATVTALSSGGVTGPPTHTATASQATGATGGAMFVRIRAQAATVRAYTGGSTAAGGGGGVRQRVRPRTGGAALRGGGTARGRLASGPIVVSGGARIRGGGTGSVVVQPAVVHDMSGGASLRPVGTGSRDAAREVARDGGGSIRGGGSGLVVVDHAAVIDVSGGSAVRGVFGGDRERLLSDRSGGAVLRAPGGGATTSVYELTGGSGLRRAGAGVLAVEAAALAPTLGDPEFMVSLDRLVAGGQYDGRVPVVQRVEMALTNLTGWWGSPPTRTSRTNRLNAAGSHRRPAFKDVRSIEVTVTATSQDQDGPTMRQVERALAATCGDPDQLYPLRVTDQLGTTCAYVELDGDVAVGLRDSLAWSSVITIPVVAPDPRRFGVDWHSASAGSPAEGAGGVEAFTPGVVATAPGVVAGRAAQPASVTVTGVGTAPRLPLVFQISGAAEDLTILDTSAASVLGYAGVLGADDTVWINTDDQPAHDVPGAPGVIPARGALLNSGANARAAVTRFGPWPVLRPGVTATFSLAGGLYPSTRFTVHTRDAWA